MLRLEGEAIVRLLDPANDEVLNKMRALGVCSVKSLPSGKRWIQAADSWKFSKIRRYGAKNAE